MEYGSAIEYRMRSTLGIGLQPSKQKGIGVGDGVDDDDVDRC